MKFITVLLFCSAGVFGQGLDDKPSALELLSDEYSSSEMAEGQQQDLNNQIQLLQTVAPVIVTALENASKADGTMGPSQPNTQVLDYLRNFEQCLVQLTSASQEEPSVCTAVYNTTSETGGTARIDYGHGKSSEVTAGSLTDFLSKMKASSWTLDKIADGGVAEGRYILVFSRAAGVN